MGRIRIERHPGEDTKATVVALFAGFLSLATFLLGAPTAHGAEVLVDRLIAEVNNQPIAYSQVMEKVNKGPLVEVVAFPATSTDAPFEIALQDMINFTLIMQTASELEIDVSEEHVTSEINKFLSRRGLDMDGLKAALAQQGMTYEEYREDFKDQLILNQFQGRVILPAVKITDKDVELYYLRTSGNSSENLRLELKQLFIGVDPKASESVQSGKESLANRVYQELQGGMDFSEAVKVYSDDEDARTSGGEMPPLFLKDLAPMFQSAIEPLEEGQFTAPIKTPNGYYIFLLAKKDFAGSGDFAQKRQELEMQLRQEEVEKQTIKWIEERRRKSKIRIIRDEAGPTATPAAS